MFKKSNLKFWYKDAYEKSSLKEKKLIAINLEAQFSRKIKHTLPQIMKW